MAIVTTLHALKHAVGLYYPFWQMFSDSRSDGTYRRIKFCGESHGAVKKAKGIQQLLDRFGIRYRTADFENVTNSRTGPKYFSKNPHKAFVIRIEQDEYDKLRRIPSIKSPAPIPSWNSTLNTVNRCINWMLLRGAGPRCLVDLLEGELGEKVTVTGGMNHSTGIQIRTKHYYFQLGDITGGER